MSIIFCSELLPEIGYCNDILNVNANIIDILQIIPGKGYHFFYLKVVMVDTIITIITGDQGQSDKAKFLILWKLKEKGYVQIRELSNENDLVQIYQKYSKEKIMLKVQIPFNLENNSPGVKCFFNN